jgi:hypothetical protein
MTSAVMCLQSYIMSPIGTKTGMACQTWNCSHLCATENPQAISRSQSITGDCEKDIATPRFVQNSLRCCLAFITTWNNKIFNRIRAMIGLSDMAAKPTSIERLIDNERLLTIIAIAGSVNPFSSLPPSVGPFFIFLRNWHLKKKRNAVP